MKYDKWEKLLKYQNMLTAQPSVSLRIKQLGSFYVFYEGEPDRGEEREGKSEKEGHGQGEGKGLYRLPFLFSTRKGREQLLGKFQTINSWMIQQPTCPARNIDEIKVQTISLTANNGI